MFVHRVAKLSLLPFTSSKIKAFKSFIIFWSNDDLAILFGNFVILFRNLAIIFIISKKTSKGIFLHNYTIKSKKCIDILNSFCVMFVVLEKHKHTEYM